MKGVRWVRVLAVLVLGFFPPAAALAFPVTSRFRAVIPLGDGQVDAEFPMAGVVPTGISILGEFSLMKPGPRIMPPIPTAAEAEARTAEFIDAHGELFHVTAADLFPIQASMNSAIWNVSGQQRYGGLSVGGCYFRLEVTSDGRLVSLEALVYPTSEITGTMRLDPAVGSEQAIQLSNAISPLLVVVFPVWASEHELVITFRSSRPVLA